MIMVDCTFFSGDVKRRYYKHYSKKRSRVEFRLRNLKDEGMLIQTQLKKRKVEITFLKKHGVGVKNLWLHKMSDKYSVLFENQDTFYMFKRLAFALGEPLWMIVQGWVQNQPINIQRMFWCLKSNRYIFKSDGMVTTRSNLL